MQNLIGREEDGAALARALRNPDAVWLTLVGAPGIGKSALARQTAQAVDPDCVVVNLAPEATEDPVAALDTALATTSGSSGLLLLDGLDHLPTAVAIGTVDRVVRSGGTRVLATSRVATGHSAEYLQVLGPLALGADPSPAGGPAAGAAQQLFRAHASRFLGADPSAADGAVLDQICQRLGGVPLALVIAAHQLAVIMPANLLTRLEAGLGPTLTGPSDLPQRHRSIQRAVADSLTSLDPDLAAALSAASVFEASFDLPTAEAILSGVTGDDPARVFALLAELTRRSLLTAVTTDRRAGAAPTFLVPLVVRDAVRLAAPATGSVRDAHLDLLCREARAGADAVGPEADDWLKRIDRRIDDIRAALRFALDAHDDRALVLAGSLRNFWIARGLLHEGIDWLDAALDGVTATETAAGVRALEARAVIGGAARSYAHALPDLERCARAWADLGEPLSRARTLVDLASAMFETEGFEASRPVFEEAIVLLDELGDRWWAARARSGLGASAAATGRHRELALASLDAAVEEFREVGDSFYTNVPLQQLGRMLHAEGHDTQATALLTEGLTLARDVGDAWNASVFLNLLAEVELGRGTPLAAAHRYLDSLRLAADIGARPRAIWCLEGLACSLAEVGEGRYAARLIGLASSIRSELGLRNWIEFPARAIDLTGVRTSLSRPEFEAGFAEGFRMAVGDVIADVPDLIADREREVSGSRTNRHPDGLTNREVEVLRLIARGSTSKAIAAELFISIETVGRHISNLYRKIGASRRAEATAYAIRSGLADN